MVLADGTDISGDLLIGADGIKSAVRRRIAGENRPEYTGDSAWRLTVPVERLPPDFLDGKSSIWVGPDKHAVVYFLRGGSLLNFVGAVELEERIEESWTQKRPWTELRADFEGWHPDILTIVDAADRDACYRWPLNVHPHLESWSAGRAHAAGRRRPSDAALHGPGRGRRRGKTGRSLRARWPKPARSRMRWPCTSATASRARGVSSTNPAPTGNCSTCRARPPCAPPSRNGTWTGNAPTGSTTTTR